jgi:acyl-CoA dehydrogenase
MRTWWSAPARCRRACAGDQAQGHRDGFYACNFPEEVGGGGLGHLDFTLVERELGRGSMALTHFFGRPQNILMACEGEQKERYLPAVRGERMDALAMTEPEAPDRMCAACPARRCAMAATGW